MPVSSVMASTSSNVPDSPGRCSSPSVPTMNGCTHSRSSSSNPASMSAWVSWPKPNWMMSAPGCCLSSRMASTGSWSITIVLFHVGSVSVLETTYFGRAFMRSAMGSPAIAENTGAKPSYVRRPITIASLRSSRSCWILLPASVKPPTVGQFCGSSMTPSRVM